MEEMSSERPKQGSQGRGAPGPQPRGNDPGRGALVSRSEELKALEGETLVTIGQSLKTPFFSLAGCDTRGIRDEQRDRLGQAQKGVQGIGRIRSP